MLSLSKALNALTILLCLNFAAYAQSGIGGGGGLDPAPPLGDLQSRAGSQELDLLDDNLVGDHIDLDTGALTLSQTDVSLPGNSALPVEFGRTLSRNSPWLTWIGDWSPSVPYISRNFLEEFGANTDRCSGTLYPAPIYIENSASHVIEPASYFDGFDLYVPGRNPGAPAQMLNSGGSPEFAGTGARMVTKNNWIIKCISSIPTGGEGFEAIAPNGDRYEFTERMVYGERPLEIGTIAGYEVMAEVLYVSKISDVHGNTITYNYSGGELTSIVASDGRQITFTYSGSRISSVNANGRSWTYTYSGNDLSRVTLPDGRYWEYKRTGSGFDPTDGPVDGLCAGHNSSTFFQGLEVRHPSGAEAKFDFTVILNGRTKVDFVYRSQGMADPVLEDCFVGFFGSLNPSGFYSTAVTQKQIVMPTGPTYTWTREYEQDHGSFSNNPGSLADTKTRTVTDPLGNKTVTYVNRRFGPWSGAIDKIEIVPAGSTTPARTIENTYVIGNVVGSVLQGREFGSLVNWAGVQRLYRTQSRTTQGSDVYTTDFIYQTNEAASDFAYGEPKSTSESSTVSAGQTRTTDYEYIHYKTPWVLSLPSKVTRNGKVFEQHSYDSSTGQLLTTKRMGRAIESIVNSYNGDGTLASTKDALNRTTYFSNYHRGIAQDVTLPDYNTVSVSVDDNGWITSFTDPLNVTTGYTRNSVGWLTLIDRVSPWSDTVISYSGLGAGVVQTSTRGNARTVTTHDGYHRPISTAMTDLSGAAPTVYNTFQYDGVGRTVFTSLPSESASPTVGIASTYDGLGRVLSLTNTGDGSVTSYSYGANNTVSVTDPENNTTITEFSGFGSPDDGNPVSIIQPEGVTTTMTYDIWGNLLSATQGGVTQSWKYNNELELCRHITPETNSTVMRYDATGQMIWRAEGVVGVSGCGNAPGSTRTKYTYDPMGRVTLIDHPAGTDDVTMQYDGNGNMVSNTRGGAAWTYSYNTANLPASETLAIDGRTYAISYGYNNDGALQSEITPDGASLNYRPNGFGQPRRVRLNGAMNVAEAAGYHPNGALEELRYFNGQRYLTTLDSRQMLASERWQKNSVSLTEFVYGRDNNGRITQITDYAVSGQDKTFTYDDLGRLIGANGPWGAGSYAYDAVNNITERLVGSDAVYMNYDSDNRLSTVTTLPAQGLGQCGVAGTYTYDTRGNVTSNGDLCFTYDAANQPVTMSGSAMGSFTYDGNFKRVKQTIGSETIYSVYNLAGQLVFRENDLTGKITDYFRLGGKTVARSDGTDITWLHHDHLGSPVAASDLNGAEKWREVYLPYGDKWMSAAANDNDMSFTGHIADAATGLTYMQARYYDPLIGRFLSNDPMGFADMSGSPAYMNRYAYVANDPINATDPTGMCTGSRVRGSSFCLGRGTLRRNNGGGARRSPPGMGHNGGPPMHPARRAYEQASNTIRKNDPLNPRGAPSIGSQWVPNGEQLSSQIAEAVASEYYASIRDLVFSAASTGQDLVRAPQYRTLNHEQVMRMGREWVGKDARMMSNGLGWYNDSTKRGFRFPQEKGYFPGGRVANFQEDLSWGYQSNVHVYVVNVP